MRSILLALTILWLGGAAADAACSCQCVNGQMQPLCQSAMDIPPVCPLTLCQIEMPLIAPLKLPALPPLGTSRCRQARVCEASGNCRWEEVCR